MDPMFAQGLELMLVGMGVVFAFLVLLVFLVGLMSRLVARLAPDAPVVAASSSPRAAATAPAAGVDARTLAVIKAAVQRHREPR